MSNRFHGRPRGGAFAEVAIFAAIIAFLAAIIVPGTHQTPMAAKTAEVVHELKMAGRLASANEDQRAEDDVADGQIVLLSYPAH